MSETLSKQWDDKFLSQINVIGTYSISKIPNVVKDWQHFFERTIMPAYHRDYGSLLENKSSSGSQDWVRETMKRVDASVIITSICTTISGHYYLGTVIEAFTNNIKLANNISEVSKKSYLAKTLINQLKLGVSVIVSFYPYAVVLSGKEKISPITAVQSVAKMTYLTGLIIKEGNDLLKNSKDIDFNYLNQLQTYLKDISEGISMDRAIEKLKNWDKIDEKNKEINELIASQSAPVTGNEETFEIDKAVKIKEEEKNSLGFFKFSEKKRLSNEVEELKRKKTNLLEDLKKKRNEEIGNKIYKLRQEIKQYM